MLDDIHWLPEDPHPRDTFMDRCGIGARAPFLMPQVVPPGAKPMTVFHVYLDETGNDSGPWTHVIGLLAPHNIWRLFDQNWQTVLHTPPSIQHWHTNSAKHGQLDAAGDKPRKLLKDEAFQKEMSFARIFPAFANSITAVTVEMDDADHAAEVIGKVDVSKTGKKSLLDATALIEDKVFWAMREAVFQITDLAGKLNDVVRPGEPYQVWYIFEDTGNTQKQIRLQLYLYMVRMLSEPTGRERIGPCIFVPGKGRIGWVTCQAADLYAWHIQNMAKSGVLQPAWDILGSLSHRRFKVTAEQLRQAVADIKNNDKWQL